MRLRTSFCGIAMAASCITASGCTGATEPVTAVPSALVGTWEGDTSRHTPRGTTTVSLRIETSGRFEYGVRTTGLYPSQAPDELTSRSREVGQLNTVAERALFRSDSVYVLNFPDRTESARVVVPTAGGFGNATLFDGATFTVRGDVLELTYLSYPADAPVQTSRRFVRVK